MSETFLSDLVNLNAILVAAMAFLIPNFLQTSKLNEFAGKLGSRLSIRILTLLTRVINESSSPRLCTFF